MKKIAISLKNDQKIYFLGDFHLGSPNRLESIKREQKIISFINSIQSNARDLFFMGDLFDFWFEYKEVVPKGFVRFIGKIAELSDNGTNIHMIVGNHDMWMMDYFNKELNINIYHGLIKVQINNNLLLVGHGDGLGKGDIGYKLLKILFKNQFVKFLYRWIHPDIGIKIGKYLSNSKKRRRKPHSNINNNRLFDYCRKIEKKSHNDYYIFGHSHLSIEKTINKKSKYINVGEWLKEYSYLEVSNKDYNLKKFSS